jgi:hypothetical protein
VDRVGIRADRRDIRPDRADLRRDFSGVPPPLSKFDAKFGYAENFDAASNAYSGLIYAKAAPDSWSIGTRRSIP